MLMTLRVHPFPYRTRKLSSVVPKILGWRRPGKIGRCQHQSVHPIGWAFFRNISYITYKHLLCVINYLCHPVKQNCRGNPHGSFAFIFLPFNTVVTANTFCNGFSNFICVIYNKRRTLHGVVMFTLHIYRHSLNIAQFM